MRTGRRPQLLGAALALALACGARPARGEATADAHKTGYAQVLASAGLGSGLRFNNPYRLPHVLGDDAEGPSRLATSVELGVAASFGDPTRLLHGVSLRTTFAAEGVGQVVVTPAYLVSKRFGWLGLYGRPGVAVVLTPDATLGLELGLGAIAFVRGGVGVYVEAVPAVFYGAGTREVGTASYPLLAGQAGIAFAWEALP